MARGRRNLRNTLDSSETGCFRAVENTISRTAASMSGFDQHLSEFLLSCQNVTDY